MTQPDPLRYGAVVTAATQRHIHPLHDDYPDGLQDAWIGAILACRRYNPDLGRTIESWVWLKADGEVLDGIRRRDIVKRRSAWDPDDPALRPALRLDRPLPHGGGTFGDLIGTDDTHQERVDLDDLIDRLPRPGWRHVIRAVFYDDRRLDEIGVELGVTGARVCQIKRDALAALRAAA